MITFEKPGKENTDKTIELAIAYAKEHGIKNIVVASGSGFTASKLKAYASDFNIAAVTLAYGYKEENKNSFPNEVRKELENAGMRVVTAAHALSGAERSMSAKFTGVYPIEIMAHTLRMFGQGTKVCVECSTMAADCGAVPSGEPILAIAGTGGGADTALILKAAPTQHILNTKICEIICKPSLK